MRVILAAILGAALLAGAMPAQAEIEQRVALVIGNNAYRPAGPDAKFHFDKLSSAVPDAQALAAKLRSLGFATVLATDLTRRDMLRAIIDFGAKLKPGVAGLFYYSGHGVQGSNGHNYLIPVDARIESDTDLQADAVDADTLKLELDQAHSRVNIVILDACRDKIPGERGAKRGGLAEMTARGTIVSYATAPGKVAGEIEGPGGHGLYTGALLTELDHPDRKIEDLFKHVAADVIEKTNGDQEPWFESSFIGDFYFAPPSSAIASNEAKPTPTPVALTIPAAPTADDLFQKGKIAFDAKNYTDALTWYRRAADMNQPRAAHDLGLIYDRGLGVPANGTEALHWFMKAAQLGDADSAFDVGLSYDLGRSVHQDYAEAMRWYKNAADLGQTFAMEAVGRMYDAGHGVAQNYAEAIRWYKMAATQGVADAMARVGYFYENGYGVLRDHLEARRWMQRAADLGYTWAQSWLAAHPA